MNLHISFGVQYGYQPHPAGGWVHPDGYLTVVGASTWEQARYAACVLLGTAWSFDYREPPAPRYFPRGELAVLDARDWTLTVAGEPPVPVVAASERFPFPSAAAPGAGVPGAV